MSLGFTLALTSALLAGLIALASIARTRPSAAHWSFSAGLAVLAVEAFCFGLAADALLPDTIVYWEKLGFAAMSLLPGIWLLFSLSYGRGNHAQFIARWRYLLWGAFIVPVGVAAVFHTQLVYADPQQNGKWVLRLGTPGLALTLMFLLSSVLV